MRRIILLAVLAVSLVGCRCGERRYSNTRSETKTETEGKVNLLNAEDFDMETVISMVKAEKVSGAEELEKLVNDESSGINNVDADGDKKTDYIAVKEGKGANGAVKLSFMAIPSSTSDEKEAVEVANLSFSKTTKDVHVEGGYPAHVGGYDSHYYHYRSPMSQVRDALFLAYILSPGRPMYYRPMYASYRPYGVRSASQMRTTRTTHRTQSKVAPVKKSKPSASYKSRQKHSSKVPSKFKAKQAAKTKSFKSRAGSASKFKARSGNKAKPKASGWNRKSKPKAASKPKKSWGSSSRSKPSRSRSRSSSSRRRSDMTFKTNITQLPNALKRLHQIRGVRYFWKPGKGHDTTYRQVGVLAQDVEKVLPEAVSRDDKGLLVDYQMLIPLMIEANRELARKVTALEQRCPGQ